MPSYLSDPETPSPTEREELEAIAAVLASRPLARLAKLEGERVLDAARIGVLEAQLREMARAR